FPVISRCGSWHGDHCMGNPSGEMTMRFRGALIDLDGTVYFKSAAIPGVREAVERIRAAGIQLRFLSNTDSITSASLGDRVRAFGVPVETREVYTAVDAARQFLEENQGKSCHCLLSRELSQAFDRFRAVSDGKADYVLVGDCRESISYESLNAA